MKKQSEKNKSDDLPKWLKYVAICIALLYLIWVLFIKKAGPQRKDFPFF